MTQTQAKFTAPLHADFGDGQISPRRLALLQAIDATGSMSQAGKQIGMTYKAAWDAVEIMNNLAGVPLVAVQHGGRGGGATLTETGTKIVTTYERLTKLQAEWMANLESTEADLLPLMRRIKMQTSARNSFVGTISQITTGAVNAEVTLQLQGEDKLVATVTSESLTGMGLKVGSEAWALIKASWIILADPKDGKKTSARNSLCGKVTRITQGPVNVEVVIELPGGNTLAAIITQGSMYELNLTEGCKICALIKASHILLGTTD